MDSIVERLPARGARSAGCPGTHGGQLGHGPQTYVRRQPEQSVLHRVIREHLETFLAEARQRGGGEGLPRFVERELREIVLVFVPVFVGTSTSTDTIHDQAGAWASAPRTWSTACSAACRCASGS
jgi:hypothetical protein